ncbi:sodium:solute symporter family protein [Kroppenstedtia eburnea]|uniref:sodium:solute symporter family protein n=1 Tax=Kroppenstedtia eburnea TaxID=714067 RepID=UPI003632BA1C
MSTLYVWWGIALFVLLSLLIAYMARSGKATSLSDYFLANRSLGGGVSALSYSATTFSAFMLVGLAGLTYQGGVGALGFELIYLSGMVLFAFFGPRFWLVGKRFGYVTPSELLGDRYGSQAVAAVTALASCLFLIPYSAVQLAGVGYLLEGMTGGGISFTTGAVLATVLAVLLSWIAGMRSVAWTDAFQALVMIITATWVVLIVIDGLGGFSAFFGTLEARKPELLAVPGNGFFSISTFIGLTLPWFFFSISNPQVSQRMFMPKNLGEMRRMLIIFLIFGFLYTLVAVLWGFSAAVHFPSLSSPDLATPRLLASDLVPPVLAVVVMVGIMAAAISTVDSILLTLSSLFARDLYGVMQKKTDVDKQLMVGKVVIPVIAVCQSEAESDCGAGCLLLGRIACVGSGHPGGVSVERGNSLRGVGQCDRGRPVGDRPGVDSDPVAGTGFRCLGADHLPGSVYRGEPGHPSSPGRGGPFPRVFAPSFEGTKCLVTVAKSPMLFQAGDRGFPSENGKMDLINYFRRGIRD